MASRINLTTHSHYSLYVQLFSFQSNHINEAIKCQLKLYNVRTHGTHLYHHLSLPTILAQLLSLMDVRQFLVNFLPRFIFTFYLCSQCSSDTFPDTKYTPSHVLLPTYTVAFTSSNTPTKHTCTCQFLRTGLLGYSLGVWLC